jgi:hypothetical protein
MRNAATAAMNVATVTARAANADVAVAAMTADAVAETATAMADNHQRRVRNRRAAMLFSAAGATTKPRATLSPAPVREAATKATAAVVNGKADAAKAA